MRRRLGFTLSEIIVVMGILIVLAGILFPVFVTAKSAAKEKVCWNNLHQIQLAIMMYRTNNDGDGVYGTASLMGLPPAGGMEARLGLPPSVFHCQGAPNVLSPTAATYTILYGDRRGSLGRILSWEDYATSEGENAVIVADMNHGDRSVPLLSPFFVHRGIGVRLNGQVFTQSRTGNWSNPRWWESTSLEEVQK